MSPLITEFEAIVVEELEVLERLLNCLQSEREAMVAFDLQLITNSQKLKQELLLQIQVLEASRRGTMEKIGTGLGYRGCPTVQYIVDHLSDAAQAARLAHSLSCLRSMAQAVQELNEDHRHYIAHSLTTVQQSLALLDMMQGQVTQVGYTKQGTMQREVSREPSTVMSHSV